MNSNITFKLVTFNTSWPQSANPSQLSAPLSEAASIWKRSQVCETEIEPLREESTQLCTNYIATKLEDGYDFISLIEETIHVSNNHVANYDFIFANEYDLKEDNKNWGVIKRLNILSETKKINFRNEKDTEVNDVDYEYVAVYDNPPNLGAFLPMKDEKIDKLKILKNIKGQYGLTFGEGICMIIKTKSNNFLTWNYSDLPIIKNIIAKINDGGNTDYLDSNKKIAEKFNEKTVNYFSDDLGPYFCYDSENNIIYKKYADKDDIDGGRPIIMSAIINDSKLQIYCAFHGVNIYNDFVLYNNSWVKISTLDNKELLTQVFTKLKNAVLEFIQKGISSTKIPDGIKIIDFFLGCDANDPYKQFYDELKKGIEITLNLKKFEIKFNIEEGKLISCCSNANSLNEDLMKTYNEKVKVNTKSTTLFVLNNLIEKDLRDNNYDDNFHLPENYGFYGDYALFGSSGATVKYHMKIDESIINFRNKCTIDTGPSDHEPVILIESMPGGKSRRLTKRNKRKTRKMKTKNGKTRNMKHKNMKPKTRKYKTRKYKTRKH